MNNYKEMTYSDLEMKFGGVLAFHVLVESEKASRIPSCTLEGMDFDDRWANVIRIQDAANDNQTQMLN